ncbi:MAG: sigma 54-interacting transcriptional regulator [Gammaproteobacteria bacterium]|nr:sigma 54-interacting transcriptional regulator [Gammaproteobacteria bacterium]
MEQTRGNASFDLLLGKVSSRLLRTKFRSINAAVLQSLATIGEHYQLDRVDLRQFNENLSAMSIVSAWASTNEVGIPGFKTQWASSMMQRGEVISFCNLDAMPPDLAAGRLILEKDGLTAVLLVPISVEDWPFGAFVLASKQERVWSEEVVEEARALGELCAISHVRTQMLNALWSSETRLRDVLENQSELIVRWLPDLTRTWVNDAYCKFYELPREEIIGTSDEPSVVSTDMELVRKSMAQITPETPTNSEEHKVRKPSGQVAWLSWSDKGIFDDDGKLIEYQSIGRDETIRIETEIALRQSEIRYRNLVENSSDWIWEMDLDRKMIYSNAEVESILGYAHDELLGQSAPDELMHPDDLATVGDLLDAQASNPVGWEQVQWRFRHRDGSYRTLQSNAKPTFDDNGTLTGFRGIDRDVTSQVQSRQELETALVEIKNLRDQLQQENLFLRDEIRAAHGFDKIIGSGPKLKRALHLAEKVAPTSVSVLILGETGTGKELIAQAIHDLSGRKDSAMISVNCAALSKDLIESELFGHEKGAFTGAHERRKGRFELADGGTLFLDEIGELSGDLQAKLLRVLQSGEFERLGGTKTFQSDVRIIAATNKDLRRAVDDGGFRADLFYRIGTFPIELPPLRERPEDIPELVEFLVRKHANRMHKDIRSISARTIQHMARQPWPGNIRELEGVLQRALISTSGSVVDYVEEIVSLPGAASDDFDRSAAVQTTTDLHEAQRLHILSVLEKSRWVIDGKNGAAAMMGIAASTLRSKMKRLGIERPG